MRRFFYPLITVFIFFCSICALANGTDDFNLKNYVYDEEGNPVFIKIYIETSKTESSHRSKNASSFFPLQNEAGLQISNPMMQDDQRGSYIVIPIKKKKNKNDDDDQEESTWTCPICGRDNPASRNTCQYGDCPLHRKGIRERESFYR
ncbi:MAG: hypothetical protein WA347_03265 [Rhabdochlamydiaceae bacterium]|jgi:hypothetical protein